MQGGGLLTLDVDTPLTFTAPVGITGANTLEFGQNVSGKQADTGKIGYGIYDNALDITGAGTSATNRTITLYAEGGTFLNGPLSAPSAAIAALNGPVTVTSAGYPTLIENSPDTLGTWLRLNNTSTGGHRWNVISSGSGNGEGAGKLLFNDQTANATRMTLDGSGRVGIGTSSPVYTLDVNGIVRAANVSVSSDARFKTDIHTLDNALENILNLRGVSYDWDRAKWPAKNFPEGRQVGFIAQEVERIFPELVLTDSDGYKSVLYQNAVPILVEAMKAQQKQIDDQKREIAELKKQNSTLAELTARIAKLEQWP